MDITKQVRVPGFWQGLFLILPIVLPVIGVSVFTATVQQMQDHFRGVTLLGASSLFGSPTGDYLVGLMQTMPGFWIVAFSPMAGWLADRFGRRHILLAAMAAYAMAGTLPYRIEGMYPILLTRCLVGMCESIVLTVTTTLLCDYFRGPTRERWLASQTGVASLSSIFIIKLGGYLGATYGWHGPFLVYSVSVPLLALVAVYCWEPAAETADTASPVAARIADVYDRLPFWRTLGIVLITVVASVMFYTTITKNAAALVALGVTDPNDIGTYSSLAGFGVPIGTVLFWGLSRLHIGWLLCLDFLIIGLGFSWMSAVATPMQYVYAANLQQIGCGLILPTLLVWATRGLAYRVRGRGNGWWQGAFGMGLFVSSAVLTFLTRVFGNSILAAMGALGKACLLAALLALVAKFLWGRNTLSPTNASGTSLP